MSFKAKATGKREGQLNSVSVSDPSNSDKEEQIMGLNMEDDRPWVHTWRMTDHGSNTKDDQAVGLNTEDNLGFDVFVH